MKIWISVVSVASLLISTGCQEFVQAVGEEIRKGGGNSSGNSNSINNGSDSYDSSISIISATYGANCGVHSGYGSVDVRQACNGRQNCSYYIDHRKIGDPAYGCRKDFQVTYSCGPGAPQRSASQPGEASGTSVSLNCN